MNSKTTPLRGKRTAPAPGSQTSIILLFSQEQEFTRVNFGGDQFTYHAFPGDVVVLRGTGVRVKTVNHDSFAANNVERYAALGPRTSPPTGSQEDRI